MMKMTEEKYTDVCGLILEGRFDAMTASVVEERINNILNGGNYKLAIDMGKVEYISSAGLRILLTALKKTKKEKGDLRLAGLTNPIKHVFDLAGFTQFFNIYPSFEEAVASFQ